MICMSSATYASIGELRTSCSVSTICSTRSSTGRRAGPVATPATMTRRTTAGHLPASQLPAGRMPAEWLLAVRLLTERVPSCINHRAQPSN